MTRSQWPQAAILLGLSARRVKQLAAGGVGQKIGREWLLDEAKVKALRHERRTG
jgi:hypothetical protein